MSRTTKVSQETEGREPSVISVNGSGGLDDLDALGTKSTAARRPSLHSDFPDLDELRAPAGPTVPEGPDLSDVSVRKPRATDVVYVHPEWRYELYVLPTGNWQEPFYAVMPKVAKAYPKICRKAWIVPYADRDNRLFLWPVLLEDRNGNINSFSRSAMGRIEEGAGQWYLYEANNDTSKYEAEPADEQQEAPEWPSGGLAYMVKSAFEDRVISDPEHEMLRLRRGKAKKP